MARRKSAAVAVATERGAYLLAPGGKGWKRGPFLKNESVNSMTFNPGRRELYAATLTNGVFVSKDLGRSWRPINDGLHVKKVWTVEVDPKNASRLYAGTQYGHLFRSENGGREWSEVTGLHTAPERNEWGVDWGFGTTGLTIHTIRLHPTKDRIYVVASGKGLYRSEDGGEKWTVLRNGVVSGCPTVKKSELDKHLTEVHRCTHKISISKKDPGLIYQQNHCGVFKSSDGGDSWTDISPSDRLRHGFSIVQTQGNGESVFTVPAFQGICKKHNSCVIGQLTAYRLQKGGAGWTKLRRGLPNNVHNCVLRDAMTSGPSSEPGVYFGTTTGEVYGTADNGENWSVLADGLGRVQGVSSFLM